MPKPSARGIVIKDDKILLIYREKEGDIYYSVPGGKQEKNETLEETVARELMEETCIKVSVEKQLGKFEAHVKDRFHYLFLCKYVDGTPFLGEADEKFRMEEDPTNVFKPMWVPISQLPEIKIRPLSMGDFVKDFAKQAI